MLPVDYCSCSDGPSFLVVASNDSFSEIEAMMLEVAQTDKPCTMIRTPAIRYSAKCGLGLGAAANSKRAQHKLTTRFTKPTILMTVSIIILFAPLAWLYR